MSKALCSRLYSVVFTWSTGHLLGHFLAALLWWWIVALVFIFFFCQPFCGTALRGTQISHGQRDREKCHCVCEEMCVCVPWSETVHVHWTHTHTHLQDRRTLVPPNEIFCEHSFLGWLGNEKDLRKKCTRAPTKMHYLTLSTSMTENKTD